MKAQCFLKNHRGQVTLEAAFLLAVFAAVLVFSVGPLRKSLQGFFLGKSNEMSTMKFDANSKGEITTTTQSEYEEKNLKGAVDQTYTKNNNTDYTNLTADRK